MEIRPIQSHPTVLAHATISAREPLTPWLTRVTLTSPSFAGVPLGGPDDRVKLFLPDPATGVLTPPTVGPKGEILRPSTGVSVSRDFTPAEYGQDPDDQPALFLDVVHTRDLSVAAHAEDFRPATDWLLGADVGSEAVVALPRRSAGIPTWMDHLVLIADESAVAAAAAWIRSAPASVRISAVFLGEDDGFEAAFTPEERQRASIEWLYRVDGPGQLAEAVASIPLGDQTFVWAAGEATELTPIRRSLVQQLPLERIDCTGYWRRGQVNHDPDSELR